MRFDRTTPWQCPQTFRLLAGAGLALLHLLSVPPFTLALAGLLAASDRSHHVAIQQSANGLQLVLRHDGVSLATHRHGIGARVLTLFAQRTTTVPQSDHVIQFGAVDSLRQASAPIVAPAPHPQLPALLASFDPVLRVPEPASTLMNLPRPPPVVSGLLLSLRSTTLVI